jgi:hypothetical protein
MNRQRLETQISKIAQSGEVAPPNTWISSYVVTKPNGKSYRYFRLMTTVRDEHGKPKRKMVKYLGVKGSAAYRRTAAAIRRRNGITALERQLKRSLPTSRPVRKYNNCPPTDRKSELLLELENHLNYLTEELACVQAELLRLKQGYAGTVQVE